MPAPRQQNQGWTGWVSATGSWLVWLFAVLTASTSPAAVRLDISTDSLRLSGSVPSMAERENLRLALVEASPKLLLNHLRVDRQESSPWVSTLARLLEPAASVLVTGTIYLDGNRLMLKGSTPSAQARDELLRQVESLQQPGLALEASVKVSPPAPETWIEFTFSAAGPSLAGVVAAAQTSESLHSTCKGSVSVQVAPEPLPASWETDLIPRLPALLAGLSTWVSQGSLHLEPGRAILHGAVPDVEQKLRATQLLKASLPREVRVENFLAFAPPMSPGARVASAPAPSETPAPAKKRRLYSSKVR